MTIEPIAVETVASPAGGQAAAAEDPSSFNAAIDALLGGVNTDTTSPAAAEEPPSNGNVELDAATLLALLMQGPTEPHPVPALDPTLGPNQPDGEIPVDEDVADPVGALPDALPVDVEPPSAPAPPLESTPGWPTELETPVLEAPPLDPTLLPRAPVPENTSPMPAPVTPLPDDNTSPPAADPRQNDRPASTPSVVAGPGDPTLGPPPAIEETPTPEYRDPVVAASVVARLTDAPDASPVPSDAQQRDGQPAEDAPLDATRRVAAAPTAPTTTFALDPVAADAPAPPEPATPQSPAATTVVAAAAPHPASEPAPAMAAAAVARAFAPPAEPDDVVVPQLVRAMRLQMNGGVGEARVQLEPRHLGAVSIALRVENGLVSAVVTAEQAGVRQWIAAHESSLRQSMAEQGLLLERLQVHPEGESPFDRSRRDQEQPARRRLLRRDNATFELVA